MSTLLTLCNDIADELSLDRATSYLGNTESDSALKIVRHLSRTVRQLAARYDWQTLRREKTFVTVGAATQTGAIPADFLRFVSGTMFNRTRTLPVEGPITPEEWQIQQARPVTSVWDQFIIRGNAFLITPTPAAGQTIAYEYITKYIGTNAAVAEVTTFAADTDSSYFDDELLILGAVWRYRKAEGTDYSEEFREFERRFTDLTKMDGGRRILDMGTRMNPRGRRTIGVSVLTGQDITDGTLIP